MAPFFFFLFLFWNAEIAIIIPAARILAAYSLLIKWLESELVQTKINVFLLCFVFIFRKLLNALGSRSLSACVCFKSRVLTNEQLRKNKSYTAFPHISKEKEPLEDSASPFIHRTSCFRLMPHFSESSFPDPNFSTISVMSVSAQYESSSQVLAVEASSEDSDKEVNTFDETVLHSWRRSTIRQRSFSDPVSKEALSRRSLSLPDIDKETSGVTETLHKVTASPSRLQFPEQPLERLKEEMFPFAQSNHSPPGDSSSIMSVVNTDDGHIGDESFYFQTVAGDEEVTDRWINSKRRQSITKETSHSLLTDIEEGNTEVRYLSTKIEVVLGRENAIPFF